MNADSEKLQQAIRKGALQDKRKNSSGDAASMVQVGFRVTPKELKIIDRKAFDKGMSRADYLRQKYRDGENNADLQASLEGLRDKLDLVHEAIEDVSRQVEQSETKLSREILTLDGEIVLKVVDEIYERLERRPDNK